MEEPVLVILAAGMGSRYGGLKQIDPVGAYGEKIIDYSLFDALRAGFKRAVFIIKEELAEEFEESVFKRVRPYMEIETVFQRMDDVPAGVVIPENRVKPWGTGHAALTAARTLGDAPFCVINADDFYGREAYQKIYTFLKTLPAQTEKISCAMVGYQLQNTVTEHGSVSRGVCQMRAGQLKSITERTRIEKREDGIAYTEDGETWVPLPENATVSMNFWGFPPTFTRALERDFVRFFREDVPKNPEKAELYLPFVVDGLLQGDQAEVLVLTSTDKWYGVTYQEDKQSVKTALQELTAAGRYPSPLWPEKK